MPKAIIVTKDNQDLLKALASRNPANMEWDNSYLELGNFMVLADNEVAEDRFFTPEVFKKHFKFFGKVNTARLSPVRQRKLETLRAIKVTEENVGMVLAVIMMHRDNIVLPEEKDILGCWVLLGDGYERVYKSEKVFLESYSECDYQRVSDILAGWIEVERI